MIRTKKIICVLAAVVLLAMSAALAQFVHHHYFHRYDHIIVRISSSYGLDPALIHAIIYEESRFNPAARSRAGAVGLMQVTQATLREWKRVTGLRHLAEVFKAGRGRTEEELLLEPEVNIYLGCWYIDRLMTKYGHLAEPLPVILASYNAGPSHATRWQASIANQHTPAQYIEQIDFPETRSYVLKVMQRYRTYKRHLLMPYGWTSE
ncbi:MAG: transglycosylase SLT domain-containing protein [Acidobacteriota bacterium]|nr:transglycosylase SLT domain-containing protein [Blastocatellia bacterium]MDW8412123.1 transglycosylase SLT domain-containing protein [Acidobacteriota bacterium]